MPLAMHNFLLASGVAALLAACDPPPPKAATPVAPTAAAVAATAAADATKAAAQAKAEGIRVTDQAIDDVLGDHNQYRPVIAAFQQAVAAKDAAAVSRLVRYPFTARIEGRKITLANAEAFVARYDAILTPTIARIIAEQDYGQLFVTEQGVMFGRGEAWISGSCEQDGETCKDHDVRVVAIQPVTGY